jgi:hypothetical protein
LFRVMKDEVARRQGSPYVYGGTLKQDAILAAVWDEIPKPHFCSFPGCVHIKKRWPDWVPEELRVEP